MDFAPSDRDVLRTILEWRRDVRCFLPTPIAPDTFQRLRATMALSPSVGNSRPWRVIEVASAGLRAAVLAQFRDCNEDAAMTYDARQAEYRRLTLAGLETAPLQLAVFTVADPAEGDHLGRRTMPQTLEQSTAMAIHTLWLAARAENIGLGMVSILDPEAMERLFAVPADWSFSAYLCLGYPREHDDLPLLHRAGWQENTAAVWERR